MDHILLNSFTAVSDEGYNPKFSVTEMDGFIVYGKDDSSKFYGRRDLD